MDAAERIAQALREEEAGAGFNYPASAHAWQEIRSRRGRRWWRRRPSGRLVAWLVALVALAGAGTGAVETLVPAGGPRVMVGPPLTHLAPTVPGQGHRTVPWAQVEWDKVAFPIGCGTTLQGPSTVKVVQVAYPTTEPGITVAVVLAKCDVRGGTPPVSLFLYDYATSATTPHLAQKLVPDTADYQAGGFSASGALLSIAVSGYSTSSTPACCPDVRRTLTWHWAGSAYRVGP